MMTSTISPQCSELGYAPAIRSEMGKLNVQLLQSKITARRGAGAGFDWYSTTGVDADLLATQGLLTEWSEKTEVRKSEYTDVTSSPFSGMNDLVMSLTSEYTDFPFYSQSGIVFNNSYNFHMALHSLVQVELDSLCCALDSIAINAHESLADYEHQIVSLSPSIIEQLVPSSFIVDPVTHQQWLVDSTSTSGWDENQGFLVAGSQHLLFYLVRDMSKSSADITSDSYVALQESEVNMSIDVIRRAKMNLTSRTLFLSSTSNERGVDFAQLNESGDASCSLYNLNGELIISWRPNSNRFQIETLAPGLYILRCSDGSTKKIFMQ